MFVSGLFCKPILCFCFELWYSSCFNVKCWFHTFPKWCSHTPMWIPILLDNRDCHVNPFQPACFSSSGSDHFNFRKINYHFFSTVFVSSVSKLPLFFPPTHLFSSRTRTSYSSILLLMRSLSILFLQCSYPVILMKILTEPQVHHFSFSFFSDGTNSSFRCWSYLFPHFNVFSYRCTSLSFYFSLFVIPECSRYLEDSCFHSAFVQALSRLVSHSSHLIQPVQHLF